MSGYTLAIDYGTSYTAAAVSGGDGRPSLLEIDGDRKLPSAVFLTEDGVLVAGRAAVSQSGLEPRRLARTPKREVGVVESVRLGDRDVPVVDLISAVLAKVAAEARRQRNGENPAVVIVTHPARWREPRVDVLRQATHAAGLPEPLLIPEPVGAALYYADEQVPVGGYVAVYDLGGGTFDTAILLRREGGFELAGPTGGDPGLGGEAFDDQIVDYLLEQVHARDSAVATRLCAFGREALAFRSNVRDAKESLSDYTDAPIMVANDHADMTLTRAELERLLRDGVEASISELLATIRRASLSPEDIGAVYLAGGSSRIPLVAQTIHQRLGKRPTTYGDPKSVISLGAIHAGRIVSPDPVTSVASLVHHASELARKAGLEDAAEFLQAEAERPEGTLTTAIVVGETKRGKSSLLNALLDAPNLMPIDADVATSVHLQIRSAPAPTAVVVDRDGRSTSIDVDSIGRYASMTGDPELIRSTAAVEVGVPHPILDRGLSFIDTPGVGGLEAGHTAITLAALRLADAMLFVTDASSPITEPELRFLRRASERIDVVYLVVTKTDLFRSHRTILEENGRLIALHAPRFAEAPMFGVSSRMKLEAHAAVLAGDESAEELVEMSGFRALERALVEELIGRSERIRMMNLLRATETAIERIVAAEDVRRRSAEGDSTVADDLLAQRSLYERFQSDSADWVVRLDAALAALSDSMRSKVDAGVSELRYRYEKRALAGSPPEQLFADMADAVRGRWSDFEHDVRIGSLQAVRTACAQLRDAGIDLTGDELGVSRRPRQIDLDELGPRANAVLESAVTSALSTNPQVTWGSAWGDMSVATKAIGVAATLFVFWPALPVMWALKKWDMSRNRPQSTLHHTRREEAVAEAVRGALDETRDRLQRELDDAVATMASHIRKEIQERIAKRRTEIESAITAHEKRLATSAEERRQEALERQAQLATASRLLDRARSIHQEIRQGMTDGAGTTR